MPKYKRIFFKGLSFSYLYIAVYLLTGILTTPILLKHFKADYFALLMLVYAIITYLNNIRFGLPESLAALLAKSKEPSYNGGLIKKSFFILTLIMALVLGSILLMNSYIEDWRFLLGDVYSLNKETALYVLYILVVFALLKIPLELSSSIFIGLHAVYLEKLYKIVNLLVNFSLVLFVAYNDIDIVSFALFAGIFDLLVSLISFIHLGLKYRTTIRNGTIKEIGTSFLLQNGFLFFQLSMTQTIIWGAGIFFVSHMLSLDEVTFYSLTMKIYIYIFYAFIIINTVLAPLYGRYYADKSWDKMNAIFNVMLHLLPFLGGFIWIGTLCFMPDIIALWTRSDDYFIGDYFVFYMGAFFYLTGYVNSYLTVLYSIGEVKSTLSIRWKEVALNLLVSVVAVYAFGLVGVVIGMLIGIVFTSVRKLPEQIKIRSEGKLTLDFQTHKKNFIFVLLPSVISALILAMTVDSLIVKTGVFIFITVYYFGCSWMILSAEEKISVFELTNNGRYK